MFFIAYIMLYIELISSFALLESQIKILSRILENFFFTLSLFSFAISFCSITILLSLGHVSHFKLFESSYNLSQESVFDFNSSNFSMSLEIVFENFSSSINLSKSFFILFNSIIHEYKSSSKTLIKIFPHAVLEKSVSKFCFKLNSSIFFL